MRQPNHQMEPTRLTRSRVSPRAAHLARLARRTRTMMESRSTGAARHGERVVAAALALALGVPTVALAECVRIPPGQMIKLMPVAFAGRLMERSDLNGRGQALMFDVSRVWKGKVSRRQTLYQVQSIDMVHLETGTEYIMFARPVLQAEAEQLQFVGRSKVLSVADCSPSALANNDRTFYGLGQGRPPR